jgi:hypothetical protein
MTIPGAVGADLGQCMRIPGAVVAVYGAVYDNTWCSGGWLFLGQCMTIPGAVVAVFGTVYDNTWCSGGCLGTAYEKTRCSGGCFCDSV